MREWSSWWGYTYTYTYTQPKLFDYYSYRVDKSSNHPSPPLKFGRDQPSLHMNSVRIRKERQREE